MKQLTPVVFDSNGFLIEEKTKATEFMRILAENFNKNLTLEKIVFYTALTNLIKKEEIIIDMNGRGRFLTHVFSNEQSNETSWIDKKCYLLSTLAVQIPEFFETVNLFFEKGDLVEIPVVNNSAAELKEVNDPEVIDFWKHFDGIVEEKNNSLKENHDSAFFVLLMKYLRQAGDELCLSDYFYSSFRKFDVIENDLKTYKTMIRGKELRILPTKDMCVWEMISSFKPDYMNRKQFEELGCLSEYIDKKI